MPITPINCKYHGFEDYRGGGHFDGRITAGLVAGGANCCRLKKEGRYQMARILHVAELSGTERDIVRDIDFLKDRSLQFLENPRRKSI